MVFFHGFLPAWWLLLTPRKNDGLRQLGWWHDPNIKKTHVPVTTHQCIYFYGPWLPQLFNKRVKGFTSWIVNPESPNESSTNHHLSVLYRFIHLMCLHGCHMLKSRLIHSFITNQATTVLNSNLEIQVERLAPSHFARRRRAGDASARTCRSSMSSRSHRPQKRVEAQMACWIATTHHKGVYI